MPKHDYLIAEGIPIGATEVALEVTGTKAL